jgi:putative GTP pyrophosphokinase
MVVERDALADVSTSRVNLAGRRLRKHALGHLAVDLDDAELTTEREVVAAFRTAHGRPLATVAANLRYHVEQESSMFPVRVGQRLKRVPTIIDKLTRFPQMALARMHDIGGCRAVVEDERTLRTIADRLREAPGWHITREYDYIADPKDDGYRALHLIEKRHGCQIEVQLRTFIQHAWAELIESFDRSQRLGVELKVGRGPEGLREYYRLGADLMAARERGEELDETVLKRFRELYDKVGPSITRRRPNGA